MARIYKSNNPNRGRCRLARAGEAACVLGALAVVVCAVVYQREYFLMLCLFCAAVFGVWRFQKRAAILQSGLAGEKAATKALARLPHEYTVVCNVFLAKGERRAEVDAMVVGPSGIFAVEVKNHAGSIVGDTEQKNWNQTRAVRGGAPIHKKMKNPVLQNRRQTDLMRDMLRARGCGCPVIGCVYFANPHARVHVNGPGVFTDADTLCRSIRKMPVKLSRQEMAQALSILTGGRIEYAF